MEMISALRSLKELNDAIIKRTQRRKMENETLTPEQALRALADGKKIIDDLDHGQYMYLNTIGEVRTGEGYRTGLSRFYGFKIYQPPKEKETMTLYDYLFTHTTDDLGVIETSWFRETSLSFENMCREYHYRDAKLLKTETSYVEY